MHSGDAICQLPKTSPALQLTHQSKDGVRVYVTMMPVYGGGGEVRQRTCRMYWCYECARALRIISYPATDVFCPRCYGRFLHEIDPPPRPALPPPGFFPHHFAPHPTHPHDHDGNPRRWVVYGAAPTVPGRPFRQLPPPVREPTRVHAPAPAPPPRRRVPSPPPAPVARRPSTPPAVDPGDYFTGGDLNRLVEELTQNDRPGPAPAPSSAIDSLPTVRIAAQHLSDDGGSQCPVCKEEFELGEAARQLPCKHVYHSDCIVPWLRLHNSCPVCRFKLPGTGAASSTRRPSGGGARNRDREREREPATTVRWGPLSWMAPARGTEDPYDAWEYGRRAHGRGHGRPEDGDAGGNDLSALQSFVLVATCVFFFSFFA